MSYGEANFGGKVFCAYTPMGMENDGHTIKLYVMALLQEYYLDNQNITRGTGMRREIILFVELYEGTYRIVGFKDAGMGQENLHANFPPAIIHVMDQPFFSVQEDSLVQDVDKEAKVYFGQ